jgi:transcriptional regulator with XRE-family HTH domain
MHTAQTQNIEDIPRNSFRKRIAPTKYNLPINERLKIARNAKELSTARVVAELKKKGITMAHSTLQGYEANENSLNHRYPSVPALVTLSDFYGCSMDYLFGLTDKIERPKAKKKIKAKIQYDFKTLLDSDESLLWDDKSISARQRRLIAAQIEFILSRTI